jgi:tetratricopeptide (TPR) repeat protein
MRILALLSYTLVAGLYAVGAFYFYNEEAAARSPETVDASSQQRLSHPEAAIGVVEQAFHDNNFSPAVLAILHASLLRVPSSYRPPYLLAAYHANRLEKPEEIRRAFEAALGRYPVNGRLRLAYAGWLFTYLSQAHATQLAGEPSRMEAELQIAEALHREPELSGQGLEILRGHGVPAERWVELIPNTLPTRQQLVLVLASSGHRVEALKLLSEMLAGEETDAKFFEQAAGWALSWGDPALAIQLANRWQELELERGASSGDSYRAALVMVKAHLELGEPDAAYETLRQALNRLESGSVSSRSARLELLCAMAYEYLRRGQAVLAESLFVEATTLTPSYAPASLGLARTYRQAGDWEAAMAQYQKVLRLDPDNEQAETELGQLVVQKALRAGGS